MVFSRTSTPSLEDSTFSSEDVHTPENPYCGNLNCWCHTSVVWHAQQEHTLDRQPSEALEEQARSFFGIGKKRG